MGVIYTVACRTCKVARDLDKFYDLQAVANREEALKLMKEVGKGNNSMFRFILLASFMWAHTGHDCTVFYEHSPDILVEELDPYYGKTKYEDVNYWV